MKIKFLSIFAAASLLVACGGNAEEAQTELEGAIENLETELKEVEEVEEVIEEEVEAIDSNAIVVVEEVAAH